MSRRVGLDGARSRNSSSVASTLPATSAGIGALDEVADVMRGVTGTRVEPAQVAAVR